MSALTAASQLLDKFKAAYKKGDYNTAKTLLQQLKLQLIQLPALPPIFEQTPTAQQELLLARDAFEHTVLLALKLHDEPLVERSFTALKAYYADTRTLLPPSPQEHPMLGLNLLRLLVQNRIAEFHTELELISAEVQGNQYIAHAIQLEQWLMEGAYNKVLESGKHLPSEFLSFYMAQLTATVREEIASCSERAYTHLKLSDAQKLMMFDSEKAVLQYAQEHGWNIQNGTIFFQPTDAPSAAQTPSVDLISNALIYAKELERIV